VNGLAFKNKTRNRQAVDGSWRREILPLCARCNRLFGEAGRDGLKLKRTGERWFGGHTVGLPAPKRTPGQDAAE